MIALTGVGCGHQSGHQSEETRENSGDLAGLELMLEHVDDRGPMHGKAAVRAYAQDWLDNFDNFRSEAVELLDAGEDTVIAVVRISGLAKLSGIDTDLTYAALYTMRDGKIARGREYWTRDDALKAAGLLE